MLTTLLNGLVAISLLLHLRFGSAFWDMGNVWFNADTCPGDVCM
jgi:hypothetical protein